MKPLIAFVLAAVLLPAMLAADSTYSVTYPPSKTPGELAIESNYFLWVPDGVTTLRGIIVHQHGCGEGAETGGLTAHQDLHWQALARKWDCALMGSRYLSAGANCRTWCDPRNGSNKTFLQAIDSFAAESGHPELKQAPWCLWGHSGGGFWASLMQTLHPQRIVAIWLRSGTAFGSWQKGEIEKPTITPAILAVPVMCNPGIKENEGRFINAWEGTLAMFKYYRARGAPIGFAPDPRTAHECGDSRYLAIPYFDACLAMRLPRGRKADPSLRPVDWSNHYLAPLLGTRADPQVRFDGPRGVSVWLPGRSVARAWEEYVQTGSTRDMTAPQAPSHLQARRQPSGSLELSWTCQADLESGLQRFLILADGEQIASHPQEPVNRFGRPLFQGMSYHDTPASPLAEMKLILPAGSVQPGSRLSVIAVNSSGLLSRPSRSVRADPGGE